jgi:phosphatidylinositol alpha-1,6-mannosyltransferase
MFHERELKGIAKYTNAGRIMFSKTYHKIEPKLPSIKIFKKLYHMLFSKEPQRYKYLFRIIENNRCKRIMEIGTWNGTHALQMIESAKKNFPANEIEYYGFDLFESLDDKMLLEEFSKLPPPFETVRDKLERTNARVHLYKGNTKEVLPRVINELTEMDFVFIDGGHSIETIENDWKYVQKVMGEKTIVIFDDYWNRNDAGCKKVIESIDKTKFDVKILPIQDRFRQEWGMLKINFVKVSRRRVNILLYTLEFPPFAGGAGIYTANLAAGLSELGYDVAVLAPVYNEDYAAMDIKQSYHIIRMGLPHQAKLRLLLSSLYLVMNWIRLRPDIICVTEANAQISAALVRLFLPLHYSTTIHGSEIDWYFQRGRKLRNKLLSFIMRCFFSKAKSIICGSRSAQGALLYVMPDLYKQATVVHYGIDLNRFNAVSREKVERLRRTFDLRGPVLLTVARLITEKGHDMVLRAIARIVPEIPDIKYIVVGTGPDRERLEALVKELVLEKNVQFTGKVPDNDIGTYYALCDAFIMVSRPGNRVEGFGLVYAEAGAYNKPVIAGRTGGVPEAVTDGYNGILVEPFNVNEVEIAIRKLLSNPYLAREMGGNGRRRVEDEFNAKVMAEKTIILLNKSS